MTELQEPEASDITSIDAACELRRIAGDSLLAYLVAADVEPLVAHLSGHHIDLLSGEQRAVIDLLEALTAQLVEKYPQAQHLELRRMELARRLSQYVDSADTTLANLMRFGCGGELASPTAKELTETRIARLITDLHFLALFPAESQGINTLTSSANIAVYLHPGRLDFERAVLADPALAEMFPASTADATGDRNSQTIRSTGSGGTTQLRTLAAGILRSSWQWACLLNKTPTFTQHCEAAVLVVGLLRRAMTKNPAYVPVRVGLAGVRLPNSTGTIDLQWCHLRPSDATDKFITTSLGLDGQVQTSTNSGEPVIINYTGDIVLEMEVPYVVQLHPGDLLDRWTKITLAQNCIDRAMQNLQLGLLFAVPDEPRRLVLPAWTTTIDPLAHGPILQWRDKNQMGRLTPTQLDAQQVADWTGWSTTIKDQRVDSVNIAIRRILRAVSERSEPEDILVDSVIVWENLFGGRQETVLRVTGALAWLLEPTSADKRATLRGALTKIYSLRSDVVHGNVRRAAALGREPQDAVQVALDALATLFRGRTDLLQVHDSETRSARLLMGS